MRISDWSSDVCSSDLPYTKALLSAVPVPDPVKERAKRRIVLHGEIGSAASMPGGCRFYPRCFHARRLARGGGVATEAWRNESLPSRCTHEIPEFRVAERSEERRVGKECASTGRSRW